MDWEAKEGEVIMKAIPQCHRIEFCATECEDLIDDLKVAIHALEKINRVDTACAILHLMNLREVLMDCNNS